MPHADCIRNVMRGWQIFHAQEVCSYTENYSVRFTRKCNMAVTKVLAIVHVCMCMQSSRAIESDSIQFFIC